jgi:hypothetical protein
VSVNQGSKFISVVWHEEAWFYCCECELHMINSTIQGEGEHQGLCCTENRFSFPETCSP